MKRDFFPITIAFAGLSFVQAAVAQAGLPGNFGCRTRRDDRSLVRTYR